MTGPIGPLGPADETFLHQIPDTFATVAQSDRAWTEKVCAMAARRDGSLQLGFGLGKYVNRNVMDGYAGISRGVEQVTVRGSRRLYPDLDRTSVGPIHYEVLEPMRRVRFRLEPNDCQPVAFDWVFERVVPPFLEDRTHQRSPEGTRVSAELCRYHQTGVATGWVEVDGERHDLDPDGWVSTRDHSWGVRYDVGRPADDVEPAFDVDTIRFAMVWSPLLLTRPDGSRYALFCHFVHLHVPGVYEDFTHTAGVEHADGRLERLEVVEPALRYHPTTRRLLGGTVHCRSVDGAERPIHLEAVGDTGFHLGTGLYFGWRGHHHGEWRGDLHVDGERIADCTDPAVARDLHQIRDTVVRVSDPVGGGEGVGNCQPIVTGDWPELGLRGADSFL